MKTEEQCKDEIANNHAYENWEHMIEVLNTMAIGDSIMKDRLNEAISLYESQMKEPTLVQKMLWFLKYCICYGIAIIWYLITWLPRKLLRA